MNTLSIKQLYISPRIERINLDNEISLVLVSIDPDDPNASLKTPEYFNNDPFKANIT
ncbi:MAG: hypothetical protein ACOYOV_17050 [Bacteroidales bacterium]